MGTIPGSGSSAQTRRHAPGPRAVNAARLAATIARADEQSPSPCSLCREVAAFSSFGERDGVLFYAMLRGAARGGCRGSSEATHRSGRGRETQSPMARDGRRLARRVRDGAAGAPAARPSRYAWVRRWAARAQAPWVPTGLPSPRSSPRPSRTTGDRESESPRLAVPGSSPRWRPARGVASRSHDRAIERNELCRMETG